MEEITLKSGKKLRVAVAPFSAANKLRKIVASELLSVQIEIDKLDLNLDMGKLDTRGLNTIKNIVCRLLASDAVENAFFECAARCTLEGIKIGKDTFEPEDARGDLLPVAWEVIRANLAPFFEGLDLSSLGKPKAQTDAPTSG